MNPANRQINIAHLRTTKKLRKTNLIEMLHEEHVERQLSNWYILKCLTSFLQVGRVFIDEFFFFWSNIISNISNFIFFPSKDALEKITNANVSEFLECHRNDIGNTHKIETLSKILTIVQPTTDKCTGSDEFFHTAHVPSTSDKTHDEITCTLTSYQGNYDSATDYEPPIKRMVVWKVQCFCLSIDW